MKKEKDINHLQRGLINTVDGVEYTNLNPIFFLRES